MYCYCETLDKDIESLNQDNLPPQPYSKIGLNGVRFRRPAVYNSPIGPKKTLNSKKGAVVNLDGIVRNISALPVTGVFDHTNRPGTIQWKTPKLVTDERNSGNNKDIVLGPVYRLPLGSDDTGAQVHMEWVYANLKVRPKKLTVEAVGPNKATWAITVLDGTQTTATWDLRETPSYSPLIEGYYTLHEHDQRDSNTLPRPG